MSESQVDAYFIDDNFAQTNIASKDERITKQVLTDAQQLLELYSPRFSGLTLSQAVADLVNGEEQDNRPFHYSFALWAIIDARADGRPNSAHISYPFMDLYDFNELLESKQSFPSLLKIFESLNNEGTNAFPYQLKSWGDMPGFAYIPRQDKALKGEIQALKADLNSEKPWTDRIEEPDDLLQILSWIEEAISQDKNLVMVMEGSL